MTPRRSARFISAWFTFCELERPEVLPREEGLAEAEFVPHLPALRSRNEFETWSQICIDAFLRTGERGIGRVCHLRGRRWRLLPGWRPFEPVEHDAGKPPWGHDGSRPGRNGRNQPRGRWPGRRHRASCPDWPLLRRSSASRERPRSGRPSPAIMRVGTLDLSSRAE